MQTQLPGVNENSQDLDSITPASSKRDKAGGDNRLVRTDRCLSSMVRPPRTPEYIVKG